MHFRLGTRYGTLQQEVATVDPIVEIGHSGYFSTPQTYLDPHLFSGKKILDNVRQFCIDTLLHYLSGRYKSPASWTTVWLAGSGVSYQWASDRGNGDLDCLFGIDWTTFYTKNRQFAGLTEDELASIINTDLKENLWPQTANKNFNGQTYELTFYCNPVGSDIRDINPYAAYNLSSNDWTVRPSNDHSQTFPKEFQEAAQKEVDRANDIIQRYHSLRRANTINDLATLNRTIAEAKDLFDSIHLGRREAFEPGGEGYGDYHNYLWQFSKNAGTAQALNEIARVGTETDKKQSVELYSGPIDDARTALIKAALWNRGGNGKP